MSVDDLRARAYRELRTVEHEVARVRRGLDEVTVDAAGAALDAESALRRLVGATDELAQRIEWIEAEQREQDEADAEAAEQ